MPQDFSAVPPPVESNAWKWWICLLLLLATTLNYMDRQTLALTKVRIDRDIGLKDGMYGWFLLLFNIGFGVGALLFGWLVDKVNLRWLYAGLVLAWSAVGFTTGFATAIATLLICRFLLGVFESGNWPCGIMTVKRILPPEQRSLGNGIFQSGTAIGAILIPLVLFVVFRYSDPDDKRAWQLPFRIVGALGVFWVVLWLMTIRPDRLATPPKTIHDSGKEDSYWSMWGQRRFYVMIVVVVAVNTPWRTFAEWLPSFLQKGKGYSEETMQFYVSAYYLAADIGSIMAGLITLWLVRRRKTLFSSRIVSFLLCASLTLLSIIAVLPLPGWLFFVVLLLIGFGTLGSFSSYFAFSQDVSAKHQGKLTGTLGLINALCMGGLGLLQGQIIEKTKSYELALGLTGLVPLLGVAAVWFFWNPRQEEKALATDETPMKHR